MPTQIVSIALDDETIATDVEISYFESICQASDAVHARYREERFAWDCPVYNNLRRSAMGLVEALTIQQQYELYACSLLGVEPGMSAGVALASE